MNAFTWSLLLALLLSSWLRWWLASRHISHIRRHRGAVPAAFTASITLEQHQKAADYTCARVRVGMVGSLLDGLLLLTLTVGGGIELASRLATNLLGDGMLAQLGTIGLCTLVMGMVGLPLSLYSTFVIERRFGFSKVDARLFISDLLKGLLLSLLVGTPILAAVLWLIQHGGDYFWLWTWLTWCSFSLLMVWAYPTLIAPRFNRFTPLADSELLARITQLLARCGFASNGVFVMDGSRRSSHGNAYFTGLGKSKRIVFFDTLLEQLEPEEIEAVLAHELGHFHHGHIRSRILLTFASSLLFLWLFAQLLYQPAFYLGLGSSEMTAATALLLFLLCMPVFTFLLHPLSSMLSRRHEYQADEFAARHSNADALVSALTKLYRDNASTLTPDPLHSAFYDSHPPASLRIAHLQGTNP
ncbi:M48 family metallopeptidase [Vogesella sp. GCM10023246]|uniref:M48 family metallopeptidase n=1 Tax=Vogesella oryzagri TaxID=3160864 RepID=A0ABV1M5V8_9NEIS